MPFNFKNRITKKLLKFSIKLINNQIKIFVLVWEIFLHFCFHSNVNCSRKLFLSFKCSRKSCCCRLDVPESSPTPHKNWRHVVPTVPTKRPQQVPRFSHWLVFYRNAFFSPSLLHSDSCRGDISGQAFCRLSWFRPLTPLGWHPRDRKRRFREPSLLT